VDGDRERSQIWHEWRSLVVTERSFSSFSVDSRSRMKRRRLGGVFGDGE